MADRFEEFADPKALCEEFARIKGYRLKLMREPWTRPPVFYVRIRYGKYCMKYFDGGGAQSPAEAYASLADMLCDPDRWFANPAGFKGWSHFGKCASRSVLALKMAVAGGKT